MYISGFQQKEFQNCYELFESNFIFIMRESIVDVVKLDIESLKPYNNVIEFFEKNRTFEQKFENLIDEILLSLRNRTKFLRHELKISFINNQGVFFSDLYPDVREAMLFGDFVYDLNNDYMYSEERDLPLFNYAFKIYFDYYITLRDCIDSEYKNISSDSSQSNILQDAVNSSLFEDLSLYTTNISDFDSIVNRINSYFITGSAITWKPVRIKRGCKKKVCKIMGEVWKHYKTEAITFEYLLYYPYLFECIKSEEIDSSSSLAECNIYKYSMGN